jgi:TRAP-type C4-dicarboxylate transport system permease small subunit
MEQKKLRPFDYFAALMLLLIVLVVTAQIVWRYIFNNSLSWSEELSRYLFAWLIFVGGALAIKEGSHIKVDLFYTKFSPSARRVLDVFLYGIITFVQIYFLIFSIEYIQKTKGTYSIAMQLPMNLVVFPSIAVGCVISLYFSIRGLVRTLKNKAGTP